MSSGFLVKCEKPTGNHFDIAGGGLVAMLGDPPGDQPIVVEQGIRPTRRRHSLQTPPSQGVKKDMPYKVRIILLDGTATELLSASRSFMSILDQTANPSKPLTAGPEYAPNANSGDRATD